MKRKLAAAIAVCLLLCNLQCARILQGLQLVEMVVSTINAFGKKNKVLAECFPSERGVDLAGRRYIDYGCKVGGLVKTVRVIQAEPDPENLGGRIEPVP